MLTPQEVAQKPKKPVRIIKNWLITIKKIIFRIFRNSEIEKTEQ
jgi:hypothetical protein